MRQAIAGELDSLKERTIGKQLFSRDQDYDAREDTVVRVAAADVRHRLTQYYEQEGRHAKVVISLPKGRYSPEFSYTLQPYLPLASAPTPTPVQPVTSPTSSRWAHFGWPGMCLLLAIVVIAQWFRVSAPHASSVAGTSSMVTLAAPWNAIQASRQPVEAVIPDAGANILQLMGMYRLSLDDYIARRYVPVETALGPGLKEAARAVSVMQAATFGSAVAAGYLVALGKDLGIPVVLRFARDMR